MKNTPTLFFFAALFILFASGIARAEGLAVAPIFGDHMVLQRGIALPIWGTSKAGLEPAKAYRPLLANLITSWREEWGQGDFPFLAVQLPTFAGGSEGWAIVQEAQAAAVSDVPNAGYIDIRDQSDGGLHPKNKKPVGERLAELAMEKFVK